MNCGLHEYGQPKDMSEDIKKAIKILAVVVVVGGFMRALEIGVWDWETLLFFLAAAIMLLLPWAAKIKFSKDGVELEMPQSVSDLGVGGTKGAGTEPASAGKREEGRNNLAAAAIAPGIKHPDDPQRNVGGDQR